MKYIDASDPGFEPVRFVRTVQDFWDNYEGEEYHQSYLARTCVEDALYSIGIALDPKEYSGNVGYNRFKDHLLSWLAEEKLQGVF